MMTGLAPRLRRPHWLALAGFGLALYFGYHAVNGSRGLIAWHQLGRELQATAHQLAELRAERAALEHKVQRLRSASLDPDLIDELARGRLSLVDPLDVIILLDREGQPK